MGKQQRVNHVNARTASRSRHRDDEPVPCNIHPPGRSKNWHLKLSSYHGIFGHKRLGSIGELACILGVPCLSRHFWKPRKSCLHTAGFGLHYWRVDFGSHTLHLHRQY